METAICVQEIATGAVYQWPPNVPFPPDYKDRYRIVDDSACAGAGTNTGLWIGLAFVALLLLTNGRRR
jgi:hypothetical protein